MAQGARASGRPFATFDEAYGGTPMWEIGRPQPALACLFDRAEVRGRVLDAGCGTGEMTLLAAARGLAAVGVDSSRAAIDIARRKARERDLPGARFVRGDILELPFSAGTFDTVVDSGVFHIFEPRTRTRYVESIRRVLATGGRYHLLVFSEVEPPGWGPHRVARDDLASVFAAGWTLQTVEAAHMLTNAMERPVHAWRATAVAV